MIIDVWAFPLGIQGVLGGILSFLDAACISPLHGDGTLHKMALIP